MTGEPTLSVHRWPPSAVPCRGRMLQAVDVLTTRALTDDDWPLWRRLRLAALTEAPQTFPFAASDWQRGGEQRWRIRFGSSSSHNIAAFLNEEPCGMVSGLNGSGYSRELRSLWVSPAARGRGVGDLLVAEVQAWACEAGAKTLELAVVPGNTAALALYRRNGFIRAGDGRVLPDGVTRELVMVKMLATRS